MGVFVEVYNSVNYDTLTGNYFFYFPFGNSAWQHLMITAVGPAIGGIFAGSFIVFYQREKIKGKTYGQKLLIHSILILLFLTICILLVGVVGTLINDAGGSFLSEFFREIFSLRVIRLMIVWYCIVILTIFMLDVSDTYGAGRLKKGLPGKYHKPGTEERIFMFLDLKSSTAIAEQIGEEKYFGMLHFFYELANKAVLNNHGEIYQYVGDEILISWEKSQGLKNGNCLNCFFAVKKIVEENAPVFIHKFNVVPDFKSAIHTGVVATGEIGTVKKDIVYSGDVKDFNGYKFQFVDDPVLRGKKEKMSLYEVQPVAVV